MIEILSFIFGGLFRLAPKLMEMREKALDRQHEREMLTLQMQAVQSQKTGNWLIDFLNGLADAMSKSVRPVLTYWYCVAAYGLYKAATLYLILQSGASWANAASLLWTPNDHAVMFSIIGFWFVDRAIRKREGS